MKNIWVTKAVGEGKPWGREESWATGGNSQIKGKMLYINEGQRTSLKYNRIKNETLFVLSGHILLTFSDEKFKKHKTFKSCYVNPGETINVQSGCPYRIKALRDSTIVEIAYGGRGGVIPVRFHDDYGRHTSIENEIVEIAQHAESSITSVKDI
jgi:mannose-6-phosphate isomerase-like protein (cupin superfamily)